MAEGNNDRYSKAAQPSLVEDEDERAQLEVRNALRQFDEGMALVDEWLREKNLSLRPSHIVRLNRIALQGLSPYAGVFRPSDIEIVGSSHKPVAAEIVPAEVESLCDYINSEWEGKSAIHLAAYALWRINWIHPFVDGNGRTARIVSYVILCAKTGYRLPGQTTIPDQISRNKKPYYDALEEADRNYDSGVIDVSSLESLLSECLANQLIEVHDKASAEQPGKRRLWSTARERVAASSRRGNLRSIISAVESHPVVSGAIALIAAAIIGSIIAALLQ